MPHVGPVKVLTPPQGPMHIKIAVMGGTRNVRFRDPQLGPSCDDVLNHPSERKDSSDRHSQRDDHDWKHDEDKHPESRQHLARSLAWQPSFPATATLEVIDIDCVARFLK